ncbi:hypothetical protein AD006_01080 [Pseudonocardia sp. EC080610-09]|uniref:hypothetical protein n=1 Tax=unclassified Pseudonocardia TaxID=2619320 RepID=UPI0006CB2000|nr:MULTISPECIES: hypothetical protein [unclassified Pseudonocardia]ALE74924.1 hypothetical protein FRP1_21910 [Pseudonocardia sp. EC080625-04]ALL74263.1 hypothetical protein AD006_01080 [Pseudonocardia sp. EC080610-09]ALL81286.1 hypothetical protein AD017_08905 [Pseudonocardia sp. EC080619-01]
MVPEHNRLYVWQLCSNLDHPRHKIEPLLESLDITVYDKDTRSPYIRRSDFLDLLYSIEN